MVDRTWIKVKKDVLRTQYRLGRPRLDKPCSRDMKILKLLKAGHTLVVLAEQFNISAQRISQIRQRWSFGRYKGYTPKTFYYV